MNYFATSCGLILCLCLSLHFSVCADESIPTLIGSTEFEANRYYGEPEGRMELGKELILIYPESVVHLSNERIDSVKFRDVRLETELRLEQEKREAQIKRQRKMEQIEKSEAKARAEKERERQNLANMSERFTLLEEQMKAGIKERRDNLECEISSLEKQLKELHTEYLFLPSPAKTEADNQRYRELNHLIASKASLFECKRQELSRLN
jgi:hypothetical protein